ncbi:class I SAM-dependent methyltransferase [Erythrobacteraceae bacterium CFH 75059]|uniref:class I SAM-dependent methyltransferase n=1 Tax=Qipengyuania thermophila TaxID=2509361 RepID=UPI0010220772|nr:class I SAM-dependent methyltransferase [Erythrobacteraceae bacterium CFH 75059]
MGESNALYYASRDPLGAPGDFVTAPEISQMFGELVGLWCTDLWRRAGSPVPIRYVELGPGRGTLAADALRAMARHGLVPEVHFVEGSPALAALQRQAVPQARVHGHLADLDGSAPMLLVANEFLDALPVRQLVRTAEGWREVVVTLDDRQDFTFAAGAQPMDAALPAERADAPVGTVIETCPAAAALIAEVAQGLCRSGGAALLVDYGHLDARTGSTLQAVRAHRRVDPLAHPGAADLTAHVDFAALAQLARRLGIGAVHATTQGVFLESLGIGARARALSAAAPARAEAIAADRRRLAHPEAMGTLFKVMALVAPGWPVPAGFQEELAA